MRVSGVSIPRMALTLVQVGLLFSVLTFVIGEFIAPPAEQFAQQLRARAITGVIAQEFRSGLWVKDERSFVNVAQVLPDSVLLGVKIYEFDTEHRLRRISFAQRGEYRQNNLWHLREVVQTDFTDNNTTVNRIAEADWRSVLEPGLLSVLLVMPEQMSAWALYSFVQHLRENNQQTARHEIAFWNKLIYPFAVLVMMVLALPFAYYQQRAGGVGGKVFAGIMLGIGFTMLGRLFTYLGLLRDWPPFWSAILPTLMFLGLAVAMMWWGERR
jgi:lipopolysaccharide export system permease protein